LDPDETAKAYLGLVRQHRSVWTNELTLRPWVEKF
ncbi:MAG: oxidoreductase, partial [Pseudomonadota bacterium]